uniref:Chemokine interleukin-8-like domain-containing protein n=1 Tax=Denticeps clupeoides TaxID=299321 RepID=A0AAY4AJL9_9TELE
KFSICWVKQCVLTLCPHCLKISSPTCCTSASNKMINEKILNYEFQKADPPCIVAVIFETAQGRFCSAPRAKWVIKYDLLKKRSIHFYYCTTFKKCVCNYMIHVLIQ